MSNANGSTLHVDVAIVGSGFAGIGMGHRLKEAGMHDFAILERGEDVGGTWWWNSYPGCQCDIPSHLYSFSFALNPDWTRTYSMQEEIHRYLRGCAERFGLLPHVRFGHEVKKAAWNDEEGRWDLDTTAGPLTARVLIGGQGGLSEPRIPAIPGREDFEGPSFHSAQWDHSVDLRGKRVAVLGTGASAIQIVPSIQPEVERLFVFQRTPPWVMPHSDRPTTRVERAVYRRFPALQRFVRNAVYSVREVVTPGFTRNTWPLSLLERRAQMHLRSQVKDPELREKLTPDYRIGCKRILPSDKWYPAIQEENVEVVTAGIAGVTARGIRTADGAEHEVDVIVYATGFHVTEIPFGKRVVGREGKALSEIWDGSPQAYKGTTVPGFPNLFFVLGPNTGLGNNSIIYMIESQIAYVMDALRTMTRDGLHAVEVKPEAHDFWNHAIQRRMPPTVWNSGGCSSWYIDRNGKNTTIWPDFTWRYRRLTRQFDVAAYATEPVRPGLPQPDAIAA